MTFRNGQSMHELTFVIWLGQRNWSFSLPSTARLDLKLPHEFFIIQTNFIIGRFSHQDFQIYYLHHLHSVYTLFNSEAFDTWSTASAMICCLFFDIICIFPKRRWRFAYRRVVFKPWFHAVLPAFWTLDKYWCDVSRYTDRFHYIFGPDKIYDSNNE